LKARPFYSEFHFSNWIPLGFSGENLLDHEEMILKYKSLVEFIAQRLVRRLPPHTRKEDLYGAGVIGLIDAINKFDPGKKVQFKTYAEFRIRGAMLDELRSQDCVSRITRGKAAQLGKTLEKLQRERGRQVEDEEMAQELGLSLESYYRMVNETSGAFSLNNRTGWDNSFFPEETVSDSIADKNENNPFNLLSQEESKKIIIRAIGELSFKERMVIFFYYHQDLKLWKIAKILGCSESRVCQIRSKALLKLKFKITGYFKGDSNSSKRWINKDPELEKAYS